MAHLEIQVEGTRPPTARLRGDLDLGSMDHASMTLVPLCDADALDVELAELSFIDSSGLKVFIELQRRASAAGTKLRLVNPRPQARQLFDMTGTSALFSIHGVPA